MQSMTIDLLPLHGIEGTGPRWTSKSNEPWFSVKTDRKLAGRWIKIVWRSGLLDPVCRPVLRFVTPDGPIDYLPGAAIFGANEWIGFAPAGTSELHISPTAAIGDFGFIVEQLKLLSDFDLCRTAFNRSARLSALGIAAWFIGRQADSVAIARDALAIQTISHYAAWRQRRLRDYEANGIDGSVDDVAQRIHVRFVIDFRNAKSVEWDGILTDLAAQTASNYSVVALVGLGKQLKILAGAPTQLGVDFIYTSEPANILRDCEDHDLISLIAPATRLSDLAVATVMTSAHSNKEIDFFISDTDVIAPDGTRSAPKFEPRFDPVLNEARGDIDQFGFWRVGALRRAGIDLIFPQKHFEVSLKTRNLSRVLMSRSSRHVSPPARSAVRPPISGPLASATIIIPTRDRVDLLHPCIDSILEKTDSPFDIIIVNNGSIEQKTFDFFSKLIGDERVSIMDIDGPFNFSRLCNIASKKSTSNLLIFLNNDTTVIHSDWIDFLAAWALKPDIGPVGAKLLYPSGKIQHAGVVVGWGGRAGHFEQGIAATDPGYFARAHMPHQITAVTGACMAIARHKFEEVNGFDEVNLPIDLNDIDLCLRLAEKGYKTIYEPNCQLFHHESATRGRHKDTSKAYSSERAYFRSRWLPVLRADPHFSPALSLYAHMAMLG